MSRQARSPISRGIRRTTRRSIPRSISSAASRRTRPTLRTRRRRFPTRVALSPTEHGGQRDTVGTTQLLNRPLTFSPSFWHCRSPVPSQMLRARSQALFRLLLLPPALDRPCDLLVLLGHLRETVLPQALRPGAVPLRRLLLARLFLACPRSTSAAFLVLRGARTSTPTFAMSWSTARSSTLCAVSPAALR